MFYRGSLIVRFLLILIVLGVLAAGGYLIFQAGQAQGYALAQAASGGAPQAQPLPYPSYYPYMMPYHGFFFPPFFGLLCIGGFLFVFLVLGGGFVRPHRGDWHAHGSDHEHWHGWDQGRRPEQSGKAEENGPDQTGDRAETA